MMNDMSDLMGQLAALQAAVSQTQQDIEHTIAPTPQPPEVAATPPTGFVAPSYPPPNAPGLSVTPQLLAQLQMLQAVGAREPEPAHKQLPLDLPEVIEPTALEVEVRAVRANMGSLNERLDLLANAMQAMVKQVSDALARVMRPAPARADEVFAPVRHGSPTAVTEVSAAPPLEMLEWETGRTHVEIPVFEEGDLPEVDRAEKSAATLNEALTRVLPDPTDGGRVPERRSGGAPPDP